MITYGFLKEFDAEFEDVIECVREKLKEGGFGVLTTIDVQAKFKEKLGIDFRKYVILGACDPASAHKAIGAEENIGLLLPCNVIVYEKGDRVAVAVIKPSIAMEMIDNEPLKRIAADVEARLSRIVDSVDQVMRVG